MPTRVTDFQVMFLFSIGITKGKWGTLLTNLLAFKRDYDANRPITEALPEIAAQYPQRYGKRRHARSGRRAVRIPAQEPSGRAC